MLWQVTGMCSRGPVSRLAWSCSMRVRGRKVQAPVGWHQHAASPSQQQWMKAGWWGRVAHVWTAVGADGLIFCLMSQLRCAFAKDVQAHMSLCLSQPSGD